MLLKYILPLTIGAFRLLDICVPAYNNHSKQKKHNNLNVASNKTESLLFKMQK